MFFDQKPAEKLGLFSGVLALDYWNQKSVEATQVVSEIDAEISSIELSISNYDHVIGSQKEQLDRLKKLNVSFITDKKNKLKVIKSDKQENQDDIVKLDLNIAEIGGEIDSILEDIKSVKQDLVKTEEQWKEADKKLAASQAEVQFLKAIYSERKSAFYDFTKLEEKKCPTCYAPVTREHYQKILTDLQKQVSELDQSLRKALDKAKLDGDRAGKLYKKCKVYSDKKSEKDALLLSRSNELDRIGMTRNNLIKRNAALDEEAAALSSEENVFAAEIKDLRANMKEVSGKKKAARDTIKELQAEKAAASYWVKGFKEIRLFLIEEALTLLEVEVNNNLLQLGLRNWKIEFDVERETKSGTISKGFQVFIKSPYNKEPVPWESWSGGESQRLRLAGNLGLSSLICAKLGIQSNILVLDEPTQHLTPGGVEDLLNFLENKARTENRQIWMIDHNALDYGGFTSVTQIVKSSAGSSINIEVRDGE